MFCFLSCHVALAKRYLQDALHLTCLSQSGQSLVRENTYLRSGYNAVARVLSNRVMMKEEKLESDNPYAMPVEVQSHVPSPVPMGARGTFVRQVKPLCICMIIQGVLEVLMGVGIAVAGFAVPTMIMNQQAAGGGPPVPQAAQIQTVMLLAYGVMGSISGVAGVLRIVAGIRGLYFRGYALGVASHFFGMANVLTCYCLPTALALCIWGCMVYFNFEVKYAFKMGAEGQDPSEIEAGLSGYFRG